MLKLRIDLLQKLGEKTYPYVTFPSSFTNEIYNETYNEIYKETYKETFDEIYEEKYTMECMMLCKMKYRMRYYEVIYLENWSISKSDTFSCYVHSLKKI